MSKQIGILDSGLGGYTVYNALCQSCPEASFVFLADQKNAPYGDRTPESIFACSARCIEWFVHQGIEEVIIACNTISSTCLDQLKHNFPSIAIYGIIDLTASQFKETSSKHVAVIATQATTNSHAYQREIKALQPNLTVREVAMPCLVPLIEGLASDEEIDNAVKTVMQELNQTTDTLVLGCTHYPLVFQHLSRYYTHPIIDSIQPIIELVKTKLHGEAGQNLCYTTGNPHQMRNQVHTLFDQDIVVNQLNLEVSV